MPSWRASQVTVNRRSFTETLLGPSLVLDTHTEPLRARLSGMEVRSETNIYQCKSCVPGPGHYLEASTIV